MIKIRTEKSGHYTTYIEMADGCRVEVGAGEDIFLLRRAELLRLIRHGISGPDLVAALEDEPINLSNPYYEPTPKE